MYFLDFQRVHVLPHTRRHQSLPDPIQVHFVAKLITDVWWLTLTKVTETLCITTGCTRAFVREAFDVGGDSNGTWSVQNIGCDELG